LEGLSLCYTDEFEVDKHFLVSRDDPCGDMCIICFRFVSWLPRCFLEYLLQRHCKELSERVWRNTRLSAPAEMNVWAIEGLARAHKYDAIVEHEPFDDIKEERYKAPRAWRRMLHSRALLAA
jgi:hypothetical protein